MSASECVDYSAEQSSILRNMLPDKDAIDNMGEASDHKIQDSLPSDDYEEIVLIVKDEPKVEVVENDEEQKGSIVVGFLKQETSSASAIIEDDDFQYENLVVKMYNSHSIKEEPMENISEIFKNSCLEFEKQAYHRQVFNDILKNMGKKKLEELQSSYVEYIRKAADLASFSCLKCEYRTIHKANLETHLHVIHKKGMEESWYKCLQCQHKVRTLRALKSHQLIHNESGDSLYDLPIVEMIEIQECDLCTFTSESRELFEDHKKTHKCPDDPKKFQCYLCDYGVNGKKSMQKHLLKVHEIRLKCMETIEELKCNFCDYKTDSKECFEIHSMRHKNPDEITWLHCNQCDFKTKHRASLRNHVLNHEGNPEKKFLCEICSKRFRRKAELQGHMLTHKDISELKEVTRCPHCSFQTKYKVSLTQHMELHREPEYICHVCGFKNRRKYNHKMHLRTHQNFNECETYRCAVCPYETKFKVLLKNHLISGKHKSMDWKPRETNYRQRGKGVEMKTVCDICGDKLSTERALLTHLNIHKDPSELPTYKCSDCNFETKSKYSFYNHRNEHIQPRLNCEVCGMQLKKKNYKSHLRTHQTVSESEMSTCSLCNYETKFKAYLREHLKKRHNILTARRPGRRLTVTDIKSESGPQLLPGTATSAN